MCGIAGIVGNYHNFDFKAMLNSQHHRGPDATVIEYDQNISVFGHNRLSIIDLSTNANQPFFDNSKRYCVVFNGEIYNYLEIKNDLKNQYDFKTTSDTEVLLAAYIIYGQNFLHRLNGMFAFAIWDFQTKTLFAARDRFGVKPFFYAFHDGCFLFSSEIKALHAAGIPKIRNQKVWAQYFAFDYYGNPDETFFDNINQLAGSHFLIFENKNLIIKKWYHFAEAVAKYNPNIAFDEAKSQYLSLLKDSISLRCRADVPIGINISGGLDSSLLLYLVNKHDSSNLLKAFTFYTNDKKYDELQWVETVTNLTKNQLEKVLLNSNEVDILLQKTTNCQDEPFGGIPTLAYAKIFEKARSENVLVLLDGQGLDEQFAGYDYYLQDNNNLIQGTKNVNKFELLSDVLKKQIKPPIFPKPFPDGLRNKQYRDLFYTKIPRALRFNDRISMASSTELREPFLDYRLVELAFSLPQSYKINKGISKFLIREIASAILPNDIAFTPKRALQTPQREWLFDQLRDLSKSSIQKIIESECGNMFDIDEFKKQTNRFLTGDNENSFLIWQCISLASTV